MSSVFLEPSGRRELRVTQGGPVLRARVGWRDSQVRWALLDLQDLQDPQDLRTGAGSILETSTMETEPLDSLDSKAHLAHRVQLDWLVCLGSLACQGFLEPRDPKGPGVRLVSPASMASRDSRV